MLELFSVLVKGWSRGLRYYTGIWRNLGSVSGYSGILRKHTESSGSKLLSPCRERASFSYQSVARSLSDFQNIHSLIMPFVSQNSAEFCATTNAVTWGWKVCSGAQEARVSFPLGQEEGPKPGGFIHHVVTSWSCSSSPYIFWCL